MDEVYRNALYGLFGTRVRTISGGNVDNRPLVGSPFTLDELLAEQPDIDALAHRLGQENIDV